MSYYVLPKININYMSNVEVLYKCNNILGEGITYSSKNNTLY